MVPNPPASPTGLGIWALGCRECPNPRESAEWAIHFVPPIGVLSRRTRSGGGALRDKRRVWLGIGGERALDEPEEEQPAVQ